MIGAIRDKETADIAARAAITGHLVLSTIHTYNAAMIQSNRLIPSVMVRTSRFSSSIILLVSVTSYKLIITHEVPRPGMVVTNDTGDYDNIHPARKQEGVNESLFKTSFE